MAKRFRHRILNKANGRILSSRDINAAQGPKGEDRTAPTRTPVANFFLNLKTQIKKAV